MDFGNGIKWSQIYKKAAVKPQFYYFKMGIYQLQTTFKKMPILLGDNVFEAKPTFLN
jgi:hypothetical protein